MAGFVRDHTTDPTIKTLAYDIETSQFNQVGQMQGWLDAWGLPTTSSNGPLKPGPKPWASQACPPRVANGEIS